MSSVLPSQVCCLTLALAPLLDVGSDGLGKHQTSASIQAALHQSCSLLPAPCIHRLFLSRALQTPIRRGPALDLPGTHLTPLWKQVGDVEELVHLLRESGAAFGGQQVLPTQSSLTLQPGLTSPGMPALLRPSRYVCLPCCHIHQSGEYSSSLCARKRLVQCHGYVSICVYCSAHALPFHLAVRARVVLFCS